MSKTKVVILCIVGVLTLGVGLALWWLWTIARRNHAAALLNSPPTDPRQPADKLWNELTDVEVKHFHSLISAGARNLSELAYKTHGELTKYLFTANAGAAAGLFVLLKDTNAAHLHFLAFAFFMLGVFCVGVAHFFYSNWADGLSAGAWGDLHKWGRSEINVREIDARMGARNRSWKVKVINFGVRASFVLLIAGGIVAAIPFFQKVG